MLYKKSEKKLNDKIGSGNIIVDFAMDMAIQY